MTTLSAPAQGRRAHALPDSLRPSSSADDLGARRVVLWLLLIAALSLLLRAALVQLAQAPMVFNDELGYAKLAQSIGLDGRLAVLGNEGFSYSPLYPTLLAPIYALGASGPTAYALIKIVNAFLISLAILPLYAIARFALSRRESLIVVGLSFVAPFMAFPAFTMSENVAFPLCLVALWATLATISQPSFKRDLVLVLAIAAATAARIQLIVLVPAALTSILLVAALGRNATLVRRVVDRVKTHWLVFAVTGAGLLSAGVAALAGNDVYSAFGRYAAVWTAGLPDPGHVMLLTVHHLAGLDLGVGVIPFVGALVAVFIFIRDRFPTRYVGFAAVAASFTAWLLLEVAIDAALFDGPGKDKPRIHERFLIYAMPLLFVAFVASVRARRRPRFIIYGAAALAMALPPLIPFATYVDRANVVETFALVPFGRWSGEVVTAIPFAPAIAFGASAVLALIYARLGRRSLRSAAAVLAALTALVWGHVAKSSAHSRSALPARADWVDSARPTADVILISAGREDAMSALQTAYLNFSIAKVYRLCWLVFGADADERQLSIDRAGGFRDASKPLVASYAVVPERLRIRGTVVARNPNGRQVLVRPFGHRVSLSAGAEVPGCQAAH